MVTALDRFQNESATTNTATVTTLPLQLIHFTVKENSNSIAELNFSTEKEINVSHFEVERAANNAQFIFQQKIIATNSVGVNNYSLQDNISNLKGVLYYRLKMVDKDGSFKYSNILSLTLSSKGDVLKVYPTIISKGEKVNVILPQSNLQKVNYTIIDIAGRMVQHGTLQVSNSITIQISNKLNNGSYYIQIMADGLVLKTPIIIQ